MLGAACSVLLARCNNLPGLLANVWRVVSAAGVRLEERGQKEATQTEKSRQANSCRPRRLIERYKAHACCGSDKEGQRREPLPHRRRDLARSPRFKCKVTAK
jgi:hypothetical protein